MKNYYFTICKHDSVRISNAEIGTSILRGASDMTNLFVPQIFNKVSVLCMTEAG